MQKTENKIRKVLNISSDAYHEMVYEHGCAYLEARKKNLVKDTGCKEEQAEKYTNIYLYSRIWWKWWLREWQAVDRIFLRLECCSAADYITWQENRLKVPHESDIDLILDNYLITKELTNLYKE